jgi:hypothetical protein
LGDKSGRPAAARNNEEMRNAGILVLEDFLITLWCGIG